MKPTFTDRPFDYTLTQRESRDSVRYASAVHQIRDRDDAWGRHGMGALLVILLVALVVIVATGKP